MHEGAIESLKNPECKYHIFMSKELRSDIEKQKGDDLRRKTLHSKFIDFELYSGGIFLEFLNLFDYLSNNLQQFTEKKNDLSDRNESGDSDDQADSQQSRNTIRRSKS